MGNQFEEVLYEVRDHVAWVTMNRPQSLNARTRTMLEELDAAFQMAEKDREVRAIAITGAGRAFCAGADVKAWDARIQSGDDEGGAVTRYEYNEFRHALQARVYHLSKPTVAVVNGYCIGAGMDLALAADIRICADSAKFAMAYIKRGLIADEGGAYLLPRIVGRQRAAEILFSGRFVEGPEAEKIGLVLESVPDDKLRERADELLASFVSGAPVAMSFMKRAISAGETQSLTEHLDLVSYYMSVVNDTEDIAEGMRAFAERREPVFKGR